MYRFETNHCGVMRFNIAFCRFKPSQRVEMSQDHEPGSQSQAHDMYHAGSPSASPPSSFTFDIQPPPRLKTSTVLGHATSSSPAALAPRSISALTPPSAPKRGAKVVTSAPAPLQNVHSATVAAPASTDAITSKDTKDSKSEDAHLNIKVKNQSGMLDRRSVLARNFKMILKCMILYYCVGDEVYFKVKSTTKFEKIMIAYCKKLGTDLESVRFLFDGARIRGDQTPVELDLQNEDEIDAMVISLSLCVCVCVCVRCRPGSSYTCASRWHKRVDGHSFFSDK